MRSSAAIASSSSSLIGASTQQVGLPRSYHPYSHPYQPIDTFVAAPCIDR
jgi:hypothetical protein